MVLTLDDHPRWNPTDDRTVQSRILPGTEDGERIRINSFITIPEKFEELEDVLICQAEGTEHTICQGRSVHLKIRVSGLS